MDINCFSSKDTAEVLNFLKSQLNTFFRRKKKPVISTLTELTKNINIHPQWRQKSNDLSNVCKYRILPVQPFTSYAGKLENLATSQQLEEIMDQHNLRSTYLKKPRDRFTQLNFVLTDNLNSDECSRLIDEYNHYRLVKRKFKDRDTEITANKLGEQVTSISSAREKSPVVVMKATKKSTMNASTETEVELVERSQVINHEKQLRQQRISWETHFKELEEELQADYNAKLKIVTGKLNKQQKISNEVTCRNDHLRKELENAKSQSQKLETTLEQVKNEFKLKKEILEKDSNELKHQIQEQNEKLDAQQTQTQELEKNDSCPICGTDGELRSMRKINVPGNDFASGITEATVYRCTTNWTAYHLPTFIEKVIFLQDQYNRSLKTNVTTQTICKMCKYDMISWMSIQQNILQYHTNVLPELILHYVHEQFEVNKSQFKELFDDQDINFKTLFNTGTSHEKESIDSFLQLAIRNIHVMRSQLESRHVEHSPDFKKLHHATLDSVEAELKAIKYFVQEGSSITIPIERLQKECLSIQQKSSVTVTLSQRGSNNDKSSL